MADPFRILPFRIIGHSLAIGEALSYRFEIPTLMSKFSVAQLLPQRVSARYGITTVFDTLIFDGFASVLIPTCVVFHACQITANLLRNISGAPYVALTWGPAIVGLMTLFFTWENIDGYIQDTMNDTIRKLY